MDGLLARLKLGSKRKKKVVKKARPESVKQKDAGSLYSDLTASSSTVSAASTPVELEYPVEVITVEKAEKDGECH